MYHRQVQQGSFKTILILDPVDVERHTVTLHNIMTVYNDMFDHMDGVMRPLAKQKTQWREDVHLTVMVPRPELSKYCAEVIPTPSLLLISAPILDSCWKLRSCRKWDKAMDITPEDETSYTT